MRRCRLLVALSRNQDPVDTLNAHDHAFVNWLVEQIFPQPAPAGGHELLYVNRMADFKHYLPTADCVMVYYSHHLRAKPAFAMCVERFESPRERALAFAMGTHTHLHILAAGSPPTPCTSTSTHVEVKHGMTGFTDDLVRRIVDLAKPDHRLAMLMQAFWNYDEVTRQASINTLSFVQDNVVQYTVLFQDSAHAHNV